MSDALTAGWPAGTLSHRLEPWLETEMTKEKKKKNLHCVSFPIFIYSVIKKIFRGKNEACIHDSL